MSAFSATLDALFGDPNLARTATYEPAEGDPFPVRVIARRADTVTEFGGARLWSETTRLDVRVAEVASPRPGEEDRSPVKGRDLTSGLPRTVYVSGAEVRSALGDTITAIIEAVRQCLEHTPPELAADVVDKGIVLTGGGALLPGLDLVLHRETGLPVTVSEDPLSCVVRGAGKLLEEPEVLRRVAIAV